MKARLIKKENIADNIWTFWFSPEKKLRFIAGQYIDLGLPDRKFEGEYSSRWFTISSPPSENVIEVTTRLYEKHSQFKEELFKLKPNDEVTISEPIGDFILPKNSTIPIVLIAGGIGATPYRSIVLDLNEKNEQRDITLIYGAKTDEEIIFKDVFNTLDDRFHKIVGHQLNAELILNLSKNINENYYYISGPEPMVENLSQQLKDAKIPANRLFIDAFDGYTKL